MKWFHNGRYYAGGGVLFESKTHYCFAVEDKGYTDFGGRYNHEDGDIYSTISRELREETYGTVDVTRGTVIEWIKNNKALRLLPKNHYLCVVAPIPKELTINNFNKNKIRVFKGNLGYKYATKNIVFVKKSQIKDFINVLSPRLKGILHLH